jgi:hypothetical protein
VIDLTLGHYRHGREPPVRRLLSSDGPGRDSFTMQLPRGQLTRAITALPVVYSASVLMS